MKKQFATALVAIFAALLPTLRAQTILQQWSLGELDSGASNGANLAATTVSENGGINLTLAGTGGTYSSNTPGGGSTLSMSFPGGGSGAYYFEASNFSLTATSNFVVESWVYLPTNSITNGSQGIIFQFGQGDGLAVSANPGPVSSDLQLINPGHNVFDDPTPVSSGAWHNIAVVDQGGTYTLYVDAVNTGVSYSNAGGGATSGGFSIAANVLGGGALNALLDQTDIFTYTGTFNASMLDYPASQISAVPEPSTYAAIVGALALGAVGVREHRRRRQAAT